MDATKMKEILRREYGICSEEEFDAAVSKSDGIDLGMFTIPFAEMSGRHGDQDEKAATA